MVYYIVIPKSIVEERKIFLDKPTLPDGRVIITTRDLAYTKFSYGTVELLNEQGLTALRRSLESSEESDDD